MNSITQDFQDIQKQIAAHRPLILVRTTEEDRFKDFLNQSDAELWTWQENTGLLEKDGKKIVDTGSAEGALDYLLSIEPDKKRKTVFVWLKDMTPYFMPSVIRLCLAMSVGA